jgi:hypothetical protein
MLFGRLKPISKQFDAYRELDEALGLTSAIDSALREKLIKIGAKWSGIRGMWYSR